MHSHVHTLAHTFSLTHLHIYTHTYSLTHTYTCTQIIQTGYIYFNVLFQSVENQVNVQCKCHGVSGSCELKTCWRALPSFRSVGTRLRQKFDAAVEVEWRRQGTRDVLQTKSTWQPEVKTISEEDLVYLVPSPDFCFADPRTGSFGTTGRPCARTSKSNDSCEQLCCGRGYIIQTRRIENKCRCKFQWCCHVQCSICERVVERYICR